MVLLELATAALALVAVPQTDAVELDARRARILAVAQGYVEHAWRAGEANAFHGLDTDGVRVDTPDSGHVEGGWRTDGSLNTGVPYQWGGFSSLAEFDEGVRTGQFAGHAPADEHSRVSYRAVGVDCSGLVSRAWQLPFKHSSASLPTLCYALADWSELLPGDIADHANHHVMLFMEFATSDRKTLRVIEAGIPFVHEMTVGVEELVELGYVPMRYKPLDPRWREDALVLERATLELDAAKSELRWSAAAKEEDAAAWTKLPDPLRAARRGQWARYESTYAHSLRATRRDYTLAFGCARVDAEDATLSITTTLGDAREERLEERALEPTYLDSLLTLFLETRLAELEVLSATSERGSALVGDIELPAVRRTLSLAGRLYGRDGTEVRVDLVVFASERVPLHGVLDARMTLSVVESTPPLTIEHHFALSACRNE